MSALKDDSCGEVICGFYEAVNWSAVERLSNTLSQAVSDTRLVLMLAVGSLLPG